MAGSKGTHGGARKGAGRKSRDEELKLLDIIDDAISDDDWREIFKVHAKRAKDGDAKSFQVIADRRFGKAPQTIETVKKKKPQPRVFKDYEAENKADNNEKDKPIDKDPSKS